MNAAHDEEATPDADSDRTDDSQQASTDSQTSRSSDETATKRRREDRPVPDSRRNELGTRIESAAAAAVEPERVVLSALVHHDPGVLAEVAGLFSRRQFNIESLTVGPTLDGGLARMTIVVEESRPQVEQARDELRNLQPVESVRELEDGVIRREHALVTVDGGQPADVVAITETYGGTVLRATGDRIAVELTGDSTALDDAIDAFRQFGIRDLVRTGDTALPNAEEDRSPPATATTTGSDRR